MDTLVLNADGLPLSLLPLSLLTWQDSIRLSFLEKVKILHSYENWAVHSPSMEMKVPSVVITADYLKWHRQIKYSRNNIYLRDNYTCQLCGCKPGVSGLSLDHVVPKSKGGKTGWLNITTVCKPCNSRKGNNETIRPQRLPHVPTYHELVQNKKQFPLKIYDRNWLNYLDWPEEMQVRLF